MCGVVGYIDQAKKTTKETLIKMRETITYRGPDSAGEFFSNKKSYGIGLGHRRLSILDLSELGSQPIVYEHLTMVYNGEVYNFESIQKELKEIGYSFESHSDTEVILKAFHAWGVECVEKFRGMFAFAIYDEREDKLYLFRDRAGVKPLYFYQKEDIFLFGSELKTLSLHETFVKKVNKKALPYYFRFGYIPAPLSIFENTHKLKAGHYLVLDCKKNHYQEYCYWSVEKFYKKKKFNKSEEQIVHELEALLIDSFNLRMVSDVPVGVFLSGGVDSSLVTALLQKEREEPLKTFTIGFEDEQYNEAEFAQEIATYLGTEHTEYTCTNKDMLEVIKNLPKMYDEPFGDSSAIPTLLVSKLAKESVSVVLSGDGGDEAFVGYSKYFALEKVAHLENSKIQKKLLQWLTNQFDETAIEKLNNLLPNSKKQKNIKDKYQKFKNAVASDTFSEMFINASSYVDKESLDILLMDNNIDFKGSSFSICDSIEELSSLEKMSIIDYKTYMTDDILTKVDRASMRVSIEAREPLIDHKIIEYSAQIPNALKYQNKSGKYLLKKILYRYVPKELIERPKSGFQVPLYKWLRNDLKEELEFYLSRERLEKSKIYNVDAIINLKNKLYQDENINLSILWFILMFERWREEWNAEL